MHYVSFSVRESRSTSCFLSYIVHFRYSPTHFAPKRPGSTSRKGGDAISYGRLSQRDAEQGGFSHSSFQVLSAALESALPRLDLMKLHKNSVHVFTQLEDGDVESTTRRIFTRGHRNARTAQLNRLEEESSDERHLSLGASLLAQ